MPRGRKKSNLTIEQRIEQTRADILSLQAQVRVKKAELKQLEKTQKESMVQTVAELIEKSGKSVEEIKELLMDKSE